MRVWATVVKTLLVASSVAIAALGFVMWEPDRSVAELRVRWAPPPSRFVQVAGMQVHLRDDGDIGDPEPIVMIHGSGGSLHTWAGWASSLRTHRRVVTFDLPGFGLTGPSPEGDYSVDSYLAFTVSLLDALAIKRAVLVGRAIGGEVAWRLALKQPERVAKLILVASGGYPVESQSVPIAFRIAQLPVLSWISERILPRGVVESSLRNLYGNPDSVSNELVDCYFELALREGNRRALAMQRRQLRPGAMADRIRDVRVPTLILWGGRDRLFPSELAERFHSDIAASELVVFPELGHLLQEEDPERTIAPVERFLAADRHANAISSREGHR